MTFTNYELPAVHTRIFPSILWSAILAGDLAATSPIPPDRKMRRDFLLCEFGSDHMRAKISNALSEPFSRLFSPVGYFGRESENPPGEFEFIAVQDLDSTMPSPNDVEIQIDQLGLSRASVTGFTISIYSSCGLVLSVFDYRCWPPISA